MIKKKVVRVEEDDETYQVVGLPYNVAKVWTKEVDDIKTLEELGYKKRENNYYTVFQNGGEQIAFNKDCKEISCEMFTAGGEFTVKPFNVQELKAIYKYCEDLGWI